MPRARRSDVHRSAGGRHAWVGLAVSLLVGPHARAEAVAPDTSTSESSAERGVLRVRVRALPPCLSATRLLDEVESELPNAGTIAAEIDVVGDADGGIAFELATAQGSAVRRFAAKPASCEQRVRIVGLSLALALEALVSEQTRRGGVVPPAPPKDAGTTATPSDVAPLSSPPRDVPEPIAPSRDDRRRRWSLAFGPAIVFGGAPLPVAVGFVQPRIVGRNWGVRATVSAGASPQLSLGGGRFRAIAVGGALDACGRWRAGITEMMGCGGVEAGATLARGTGYADPQRGQAPSVAPTASLEILAPAGRHLALVFGAGLGVPILRPRFIAGDATLRGWPVTARVSAALAITFGGQ